MRLVAFLAVVLAAPALAQVSVLPNGDFASDVSGWVYSEDPSGSIAWEPADGHPLPGSLQLGASAPGGLFQARSIACASYSPTDLWTAQADMKPSAEHVLCNLQILTFTGPDCSGLEGEIEPYASAGEPGAWGTATQRVFGFGDAFESISVRLVLAHSQPGAAHCLFDSVRLYRSPYGVEIPAAGSIGLAVLALLVAAAGVVLLRR